MTETFAALLLAHVIADFVFQTNWMVANKRAATPLDAHIAVVLAAVILCTGSLHPVLFALTLAYLGIDFVKTHSGAKGLLPFLLDQAAHLVTVVVAVLNPPFGLTVCGRGKPRCPDGWRWSRGSSWPPARAGLEWAC